MDAWSDAIKFGALCDFFESVSKESDKKKKNTFVQNVVVEVPSEGGDEEDSVLASLQRHNEQVDVDEEPEVKQAPLTPIDVTRVSVNVSQASHAELDDNQGAKVNTSGQRPSSENAPKTKVMEKETIDYANAQPDVTP